MLWTAVALAALHATPARGQEPAVHEPDCSKPGAVCGPPLQVVQVAHVVHEDRFEITLLGGLFGGGDLGSTNASMLTNQVPTSGQTSLFTTRSEITQAPVVEGRVGIRLTRGLFVEAGLSYAQPDFSVDISADVEGAPNVTATSQLTQVVGDVGLQYRWQGRRVSPFVIGGGGYLRQLDEPRTTAETGWVAYGGGGVLMRVAPNSVGFWRHVALRGDVRLVWPRDGVMLTEQRGPTFQATAGVTIGL